MWIAILVINLKELMLRKPITTIGVLIAGIGLIYTIYNDRQQHRQLQEIAVLSQLEVSRANINQAKENYYISTLKLKGEADAKTVLVGEQQLQQFYAQSLADTIHHICTLYREGYLIRDYGVVERFLQEIYDELEANLLLELSFFETFVPAFGPTALLGRADFFGGAEEQCLGKKGPLLPEVLQVPQVP